MGVFVIIIILKSTWSERGVLQSRSLTPKASAFLLSYSPILIYLKTTKGLKNVSEKLILYNNDLETLDDELSENDVKKSFIADDNYIKSIDNLKITPRNISLNHNQLTHLGDNILCNEKIQEMSFQENNFNDAEKNRIIKTLTKYNERGERYIFIL